MFTSFSTFVSLLKMGKLSFFVFICFYFETGSLSLYRFVWLQNSQIFAGPEAPSETVLFYLQCTHSLICTY